MTAPTPAQAAPSLSLDQLARLLTERGVELSRLGQNLVIGAKPGRTFGTVREVVFHRVAVPTGWAAAFFERCDTEPVHPALANGRTQRALDERFVTTLDDAGAWLDQLARERLL